MNEHAAQDYAARVVRRLNEGLDGLDRNVADALAAARQHALEQRAGKKAGRSRGLAASSVFRVGLAAVTILAVMLLTMWWPSQPPAAQERGHLDIRLLTGKLPAGADLGEDFPAWRRVPGLCRS